MKYSHENWGHHLLLFVIIFGIRQIDEMTWVIPKNIPKGLLANNDIHSCTSFLLIVNNCLLKFVDKN